MTTCSKSLLIFILFAVLWLENKAHRCRFPHKKTHKEHKETTTSTATPAPTSTSTPLIKVYPKCNTGTVPSCQCDKDDVSYYYPLPKSGNCNDVFKRLPTTTDYHFREENCHKVQRTVCKVDSDCWDSSDRDELPLPTPDSFIIGKSRSAPFCICGYNAWHYPMPKSGDCTELQKIFDDPGTGCNKQQTFCTDTCNCNLGYVDPTKCDPQTCNNASEPFCMCALSFSSDSPYSHYPMPESGNCMDYIIEQFSTTLPIDYRSGPSCYKARNACKCTAMNSEHTANCECNDECVANCDNVW